MKLTHCIATTALTLALTTPLFAQVSYDEHRRAEDAQIASDHHHHTGAKIIGGSAAGGAIIGALAGGPKGALIGGALGAGGGALVNHERKEHDVRVRERHYYYRNGHRYYTYR